MRKILIITSGVIGLIIIMSVFMWSGSGDKPNPAATPKEDKSTAEPSTQTPAEALETVIGGSSVTGAKYFANNTWLVGATTASNSETAETFTIVAKLSGGKWVAVDSGTYIDTELLLLDGAPPDVIAYLEGVQQ